MKKLTFLFLNYVIFTLTAFGQTIGITGDFNAWSQVKNDIPMISSDNINWTLDYTFNSNSTLKFRKDNSWTVNWGSAAFPTGFGVQDGADIPVLKGTYKITFNSNTGAYNFQIDNSNPPSFVNPTNRQIVLQGFWWDYWNNNYQNGWANYLTELAPRMKQMGIDAVWIPPTIKNTGTNSVGYSPFDQYDLGDKWQKNSLKTRLGDKDELLRMMAVMKANGIDVIQDVVFNHLDGAGSNSGAGGQDPAAMDDGKTNKFKNFRYSCYETPAQSETAANYLARKGRFPKNWQNFYPNPNNPCCSNDINSVYWGPDVSYEKSAFGQSSNASFNPIQKEDYMRNGMRDWMIWYKKQMGWDGLRIDAVKHFPNDVTEDFLWNLQNKADWASGSNEMFAVGEWVDFNPVVLDGWCGVVQNRAGTFDFALRDGLHGIISGNGTYDLGIIPGKQQNNRQRTVPFVNNHDTFRPNLDAKGNYSPTWGNALAPRIEPKDGRLSMIYAIMLAVDGAPQIFFEDLFDIGYNGNRFTHDPKDSKALPMRSDIENLIWCHQNLHFKEGGYLVRWQAQDALVIERQAKALIAVTDNWTQWQNLTGVQTSWPDGTILVDYSGANGTAERAVYGGGKVDIAIPPCDGTATKGRRGYSVWAPKGIVDNYAKPSKPITQEWEMDNDLGDRHILSLQQGGRLPDNSLECRTVGKIFAKNGTDITINITPGSPTNGIQFILIDKNCIPIDSVSGTGNLTFSKKATYDGWYTMRIKNATANQLGQKCWVKATYSAPEVVQTNVIKQKCASCSIPNTSDIEEIERKVIIYPIPVTNTLNVSIESSEGNWEITDLNGRVVRSGFNKSSDFEIDLEQLQAGIYHFNILINGTRFYKKFMKA